MKGSFWWRDILRLLEKFKGLATVTIDKGDTCFLWHDLCEGLVHSQVLPEFFSFAKAKNISVSKDKEVSDIGILLNLPISAEAFVQLLSLTQ
jgi:hypothetical protein